MSPVVSDNKLDFSAVLKALKGICANCDLDGSQACVKSGCLIGFSRIVLEYYQAKGSLNIPGAETLIPKKDFKVYDKDLISNLVSETCRLCRQCRDNHANDCVIALIRNSMEIALWGENLEYPGNIIEYLSMVREKDPELASYILENYKHKH